MSSAADPTITPFEAFGGHVFFDRLVGAFYARVEADPVLRPMYPGNDLAPAEERLRLFLEQYWGGPANLLGAARSPSPAHAPRTLSDRSRRE